MGIQITPHSNNKISTSKDMEIRTKSAVKNIKEEIAEEDATRMEEMRSIHLFRKYITIPVFRMKNYKEYIAGYIYFNQGDSAWNQNGYCIAKGRLVDRLPPQVVITSLTGKWVTPLDTAIWGYQHGFYSREGSAHDMIPAMATAYTGLRCQGE